tara:strand:- start:25308 stop:26630 length:1323 start_codon:yes stop_codon:yes gene_type:complete
MFGTACSAEQEKEVKPTLFSAKISVADSIDQTGDYSGFQVLIFSKKSASASADTLFWGITDSTGFVNGVIDLKDEGAFPTQISRNGVNLGAIRLLLAYDDTVKVSGEFPGFQETLVVDSRESRAMKLYDRVDTGYKRTSQFIISGQIADSLIPGELQKWVNLYWEVYQDHKGTFASKFALEATINLLRQYDSPQMFSKLNQAFDEDLAFGLAITKGKEYVAKNFGLEKAITYLDSVKALTKEKEIIRAIDQSVIKINYDSLRVEEARELLEKYNKKYNLDDSELSFWYKNMRFDLTYLAPGMDIPEFSFRTSDGDTITNSSMIGKSYLLEFTLMANQLYQSQYEEATVIYQIYNINGLEYFTIPFDQSTNTIIAFFEERDRYWEIADPPSFDRKAFVENFNIQYFPTRILVNKQGKIVRKYIGEEFDGIIPAITETLKNN